MDKNLTYNDICMKCIYYDGLRHACFNQENATKLKTDDIITSCSGFIDAERTPENNDKVNHPSHYQGNIEVIDYIRDKLTPEGFTEYCCGNVLKYISRWRKKDGIQDLKKARVYLDWMIENAENENK